MSIFKSCFPLGLDMERLPIKGPQDMTGFEHSVGIVERALNRGINYVDIAHTYSAGQAATVLREAMRRSRRSASISAKVMYGFDRTADEAVRRIEGYLNLIGVDRLTYFTCWAIDSYAMFERIMQKGGIYEGALRLRERGVVEHICAHFNAPPAEILKMLEQDAFEGITVSYSVTNLISMRPVLEKAMEKDVGVIAMDPLDGGALRNDPGTFSFVCGAADHGDTVRAGLLLAKAHPAVDVVLGEMSDTKEVDEFAGLFTTPDPERPAVRTERAVSGLAAWKGFCTGCGACEGCPENLPLSEIMRARNTFLTEPAPTHNRMSPKELLWNLHLFQKLYQDAAWLPVTAKNSCTRCGRCEDACPKKLDIIAAVEDTYCRANACAFSQEARKERLAELLNENPHRRIGLYPSGAIADLVMRLYRESFGDPEFEWLLFNGDSKQWGKTSKSLVIHGPEEISALEPDLLLVVSYNYMDAIMEDLRPYEVQGIRIAALHRGADMPWVF